MVFVKPSLSSCGRGYFISCSIIILSEHGLVSVGNFHINSSLLLRPDLFLEAGSADPGSEAKNSLVKIIISD